MTACPLCDAGVVDAMRRCGACGWPLDDARAGRMPSGGTTRRLVLGLVAFYALMWAVVLIGVAVR